MHTTQIAGVTQMSRQNFLLGLLPAVAIYIGVFTGLGVLVGPSALELVHRVENELIKLALVGLLLILGVFVVGRVVRMSRVDVVGQF